MDDSNDVPSDEHWLTVGQAARISQVDPSTIRRWADRGQIRARSTPGGTRQIAQSSLREGFDRETASKSTAASRSEHVGVDPYSAIVHLSEQSSTWTHWHPDRLSPKRLEQLRLASDILTEAIADVAYAVEQELVKRDADEEPDGIFPPIRTTNTNHDGSGAPTPGHGIIDDTPEYLLANNPSDRPAQA